MKRRSFIKSMLAAAVAPMWLPSAGRVWVRQTPVYTFGLDPAFPFNSQPVIFLRKGSPWLDLLQRAHYPNGLSEAIRVVTY